MAAVFPHLNITCKAKKKKKSWLPESVNCYLLWINLRQARSWQWLPPLQGMHDKRMSLHVLKFKGPKFLAQFQDFNELERKLSITSQVYKPILKGFHKFWGNMNVCDVNNFIGWQPI